MVKCLVALGKNFDKPPIEELRYFLEFQIPRVWAPIQDRIPGHQRKEPVCPHLQFRFQHNGSKTLCQPRTDTCLDASGWKRRVYRPVCRRVAANPWLWQGQRLYTTQMYDGTMHPQDLTAGSAWSALVDGINSSEGGCTA
ncbi:unnamed protein product [Lupinus luteus]|uniref:Uncharacterized protein n=1 Tax=Lupinus luteus TaxID=3873 RepID=A0AAV1Y351_LUPLU